VSRRSRIVGFGSAGLLVVAGAVSAAVFGAGTGEILALVLISLGCVEAVSLVFAEVGFSEDRERAREAERAARAARPAQRRPSTRLDRMRGRRRRLP
jgi:triosephosphate isomerase